MQKVVFDISMSLDGFITASKPSPEEPMGEGGERLHEWAFNNADERNKEILMRGMSSIGAVITGRHNYEDSVPWWGADGPTGALRVPVVVVSHTIPEDVPQEGVYIFANGIELALERARSLAGDKDVAVTGGADIARQFIKAKLIDEMSIHLVPVLFGGGMRLFENFGNEHIHLEAREVVPTADATHLRFKIIR